MGQMGVKHTAMVGGVPCNLIQKETMRLSFQMQTTEPRSRYLPCLPKASRLIQLWGRGKNCLIPEYSKSWSQASWVKPCKIFWC